METDAKQATITLIQTIPEEEDRTPTGTADKNMPGSPSQFLRMKEIDD